MGDTPVELSAEGWRQIPGFPGIEVSALGEVRSWRVAGSRSARVSSPRPLRTSIRCGYERIVTSVGGVPRSIAVHRAVLLAFVGHPAAGQEARHLGTPECPRNALANLCWGTKIENEADKVLHGTHLVGSRSMRRKLTASSVVEIRQRAADGESFAALGREFGVRWQSIQSAVRRRSWKHL
jgi:hypothetical protein